MEAVSNFADERQTHRSTRRGGTTIVGAKQTLPAQCLFNDSPYNAQQVDGMARRTVPRCTAVDRGPSGGSGAWIRTNALPPVSSSRSQPLVTSSQCATIQMVAIDLQTGYVAKCISETGRGPSPTNNMGPPSGARKVNPKDLCRSHSKSLPQRHRRAQKPWSPMMVHGHMGGAGTRIREAGRHA